MKLVIGALGGLGFLFGAAPAAQACCDYGCCNCSCIASIPAPKAQELMDQIVDMLRKQEINPQSVDLVVKTDDQTVVLHQEREEMVEQPNALEN